MGKNVSMKKRGGKMENRRTKELLISPHSVDSIFRLLMESPVYKDSGVKRIADNAVKRTAQIVEYYLSFVGLLAKELLIDKKRQTVTPEIMERVIYRELPCMGVTAGTTELVSGLIPEKGRGVLSKKAVIQAFRTGLGDNYLISPGAKRILTLAALAILVNIAKTSLAIAFNSGRSTVLLRDVETTNQLFTPPELL